MVRALIGYAVLAIIGFFALKVIFGLVGLALNLLVALVWFAAIGFVFYLALKVISPGTARRVREAIRGNKAA